MSSTGQWREVTRQHPCPICDHPDWCCVRVNGKAIACRRQPGGRLVVDRTGDELWIYDLDGGPGPVPEPQLPSDPSPTKADPDTLHAVYYRLISRLPLIERHHKHLEGERGLPPQEIELREYRSLHLRGRAAIARGMEEEFGRERLLAVPGFYMKQDCDRSWLTLGGSPGLVIPIRTADGRIQALSIRPDQPQGDAKYLYLTSKKHQGPSPKAPIHLPLWSGRSDVMGVTEGHLKADIVTALWGIWTIGLPGAGAWKGAMKVLVDIKPKTVRVLYDRDAWTNPKVGRALKGLWKALMRAGHDRELVTWTM